AVRDVHQVVQPRADELPRPDGRVPPAEQRPVDRDQGRVLVRHAQRGDQRLEAVEHLGDDRQRV
ncbi:MAG: hypothetical protein AVDCRST_MAG64-3907, partial [uncultured Phycisphaerae bacterium]